MHTEVNRSLIIAEGWYNGIRKSFLPPPDQNEIQADARRKNRNIENENPTIARLVPRPILSISGNIDALAKTSNHDIYVNELKNLSDHIMKQTKANTNKVKMARSKHHILLDIPVQLDRVELTDEENVDDVETIVLKEQARQDRPNTGEHILTYLNNWI